MASALLALSFLAALTASVLSATLFAAVGDDIFALIGAQSSENLSAWIAIQIFSIGLFLAASQWAARHGRFEAIAHYQLLRSTSVASLQIGSAYFAFGATGLIGAQALGFLAAAAFIVLRGVQGAWADVKRGFKLKRIRAASLKFRNLPTYVVPQDLMTSLTQTAPYLILGAFFGPGTVGLYWLTIRTMQLPVNFMSQSVRQVILTHVTEIVRSHARLLPFTSKSTIAMGVAGSIIFVPIIIFGPKLFSVAFGAPWTVAGEQAQWVALWMLTSLVKNPAWCVYHSLRKQRLQLILEGSMFFTQLGVLALTAQFTNASTSIAGLALCGVLFNIAIVLTAFFLIRAHDARITQCV